jgi:hypothetical protein
MTVETIRAVLGWASLINIGVLLLWFAFFLGARDWMRSVHGRWFNISADRFDEIHYMMMGFYELTIFVVLLGPYLALRIAGAP